MIAANIIADSKNTFGDRLTTFVVTFPRIILAELNTHRMFSRNSASSRAIPFKKMVEAVKTNPFIPIAWQKDHSGMQGNHYITREEHLEQIEEDWLKARDNAIESAETLNMGFPDNMEDDRDTYQSKVTKQLCNRLLEPFMYHTAIITASELENFFALRCPQYALTYINDRGNLEQRLFRSKIDWHRHYNEIGSYTTYPSSELEWLKLNTSQAEIHIQALAEAMWDEFTASQPKQLKEGDYHLPYGDSINEDKLVEVLYKINGEQVPVVEETILHAKIEIAVARCARVSYTTLDTKLKDDYEADLRLTDRLAKSGHASPFEHIAKVMTEQEYSEYSRGRREYKFGNYVPTEENQGWCRNFKGFRQWREILGI